MPFYDYSCPDCGFTAEHYHSMKNVLTSCPKCGSIKYQKHMGTVSGLVFKGPGFYATDYPKEKSNGQNTSDN